MCQVSMAADTEMFTTCFRASPPPASRLRFATICNTEDAQGSMSRCPDPQTIQHINMVHGNCLRLQ